jgi:DMSO/TMAO reductase YedYZ molybdopterin-dependent catalytic subunit
MTFISRAFQGRPRDQAPAGRLPPGQYLVKDFPVLSAGPTPRTPLTDWTFSITGEVDEPKRWTWDEFRKLPSGKACPSTHYWRVSTRPPSTSWPSLTVATRRTSRLRT